MSPHFYFWGGWCPHITSLVKYPDQDCESVKNFEDVNPVEKVQLNSKFTNGLVSRILCGIPERFFAHSIIEWDIHGLFILKIRFTSDWDANDDIQIGTDDIQWLTNITYNEIKCFHHHHTHHNKEEDALLSLIPLGEGEDGSEVSFTVNGIKEKIFNHVYYQYSNEKPFFYTTRAKKFTEDTPNQTQLEETIKLLYQGIGEATFGIAFLGIYGPICFTDVQMNVEHIKMESSMRSLEALRGKYTFDFMKKGRQGPTGDLVEKVVEGVTKGVTKAVLDALKHP